jgi:hypothetical protein
MELASHLECGIALQRCACFNPPVSSGAVKPWSEEPSCQRSTAGHEGRSARESSEFKSSPRFQVFLSETLDAGSWSPGGLIPVRCVSWTREC